MDHVHADYVCIVLILDCICECITSLASHTLIDCSHHVIHSWYQVVVVERIHESFCVKVVAVDDLGRVSHEGPIPSPPPHAPS